MSGITFNLTDAERREFLKDARKELVERLYNELAIDVQTVSKARLAGLLDVDPKTLESIGMPRVPLTAGKLVKYRLSSVAQFLAEREER